MTKTIPNREPIKGSYEAELRYYKQRVKLIEELDETARKTATARFPYDPKALRRRLKNEEEAHLREVEKLIAEERKRHRKNKTIMTPAKDAQANRYYIRLRKLYRECARMILEGNSSAYQWLSDAVALENRSHCQNLKNIREVEKNILAREVGQKTR